MGEKRFQKVRRGYSRSQEKAAVQAVLDEDFYEELDRAVAGVDPELPDLMADPARMESEAEMFDASVAAEAPPLEVTADVTMLRPPTPPPADTGSALSRMWTRLRELFSHGPRS